MKYFQVYEYVDDYDNKGYKSTDVIVQAVNQTEARFKYERWHDRLGLGKQFAPPKNNIVFHEVTFDDGVLWVS